MRNLWDSISSGDLSLGDGRALDIALSSAKSYRKLAGGVVMSNKETWLPSRPRAGTRVAFKTDLESVLTYKDFPTVEGTIVTVRTSSGNTTAQGSRVYVQWDDGKMRAIEREHLLPASSTRRVANVYRRVVSNMGDLSGFLQTSSTELVHKSTQDLWSVRKEGEQVVIERLFDSNGEPLKGT
jgi:hypothetical protein